MGELAAGAFQGTAALVPWLAENGRLGFLSVKRRIKTQQRLRAYREMQHWTRSALQISCVLDWGHTCELGLAIHDSALQTLQSPTSPVSWVFTSRTLVSRAIGEDIGVEEWAKFVIHYIYTDFEPSLSTDFDDVLAEHWVRSNTADLNGRLTATKERVLRADAPRTLARHVFDIYVSDYTVLPTCDRGSVAARDRALRNTSCSGLQLFRAANDPAAQNGVVFDEVGWRRLQIHWRTFHDHWDIITEQASRLFDFPVIDNLSDLLFHDMMTGYVQSSAMLRKGAKWSDTNGTFMVHPGERGAIVALQGAFITLGNSAVKRHAPVRSYDDAALEFARYALLRCALVSRKRMTFSSALRDWNRTYVAWDTAPPSLSKWKLEDEAGGVRRGYADEMRLVLLRQALGDIRSIRVVPDGDDARTIFGGYLHTVQVGKDAAPAIIIDAGFRLRIKYASYKLAANTDVFYVLRDPWAGSAKEVRGESGRKLFSKIFCPSGQPGMFQVIATVKIRKYDISVVGTYGDLLAVEPFHGRVQWLRHIEGTFSIV